MDGLPSGADFSRIPMTVLGDLLNEKGEVMKEEVDMWVRNPMDCVWELIGNASLREHLTYAPCCIWQNGDKLKRVYNKRHTADWWSDSQVRFTYEYCVCSEERC